MLQLPELIAPAVQLGYFQRHQVHIGVHGFGNLAHIIAADDVVQNFLVREGLCGGYHAVDPSLGAFPYGYCSNSYFPCF